jgi:ketosteroid isomerase-like protein
MDRAAMAVELDQELVECTRKYLAAVDAGDLDTMEQFYAPDFVNIRYDELGRAANIPRDIFMSLLRGWAADDGTHPLPEAEETHFVATTKFAGCASVLMLRVKGGETVSYNFVWQQRGGRWMVLREFTYQSRLPGAEDEGAG